MMVPTRDERDELLHDILSCSVGIPFFPGGMSELGVRTEY